MALIKNWICTGDTHGGFSTITRVSNISRNNPELKPEETGIIILGDCGLNFYLNNTDKKYKKLLNSQGFHIYCVRGNHEQRPELIDSMHLVEDFNVDGVVWMEEAFPNIRYLIDGNIYKFGKYSALVIGGAYSVDKWYRLARAGVAKEDALTASPKKTGWFKDECLTEAEMVTIAKVNLGKTFDFVLSHTCPLSWQPTDLFLGSVDQSTVDNSMEVWMDGFKDLINWNVFCFGHYHADRIERPHVEQFYMDYETLDTIWERWQRYDATGELDWWLPKSPNFCSNTEDKIE